MAELNLPANAQVLKDRNRADIQEQIPESDPFVEANWITALSDSNANRQYDFFLQLALLREQMFWDTATGTSLSRWANVWVGPPNPATQSTGIAYATGTNGSTIDAGEQLTSADGITYETLATATIGTGTTVALSLTSSGTTATMTFAGSWPLANNLEVTISGANESAYNGTFPISVINNTSFTYTLPNSTTSPATGTISASTTAAALFLQSVDFGEDTNQDANTLLTFSNTIAGVDSVAQVTYDGIGGGSDIESSTDYRDRMLERVRGYLAFFSVDTIKTFIRDNVSGVTKVWVFTPDDSQGGDPGQTIIYFIRGNDDSIIPNGAEVQEVKDIMDAQQKPAHMASSDLMVNAPTPVTEDFTFSAISPDTPTMRTAIAANLAAYFLDGGDVGVAVTQDQYRSVIQNTFDTETGASLDTFTLDSPAGSLGGNPGELVILGAVNFP